MGTTHAPLPPPFTSVPLATVTGLDAGPGPDVGLDDSRTGVAMEEGMVEADGFIEDDEGIEEEDLVEEDVVEDEDEDEDEGDEMHDKMAIEDEEMRADARSLEQRYGGVAEVGGDMEG